MNQYQSSKSIQNAIKKVCEKYNTAKALIDIENEKAKELFEDCMKDFFIIRHMKDKYSLNKQDKRQLQLEVDRIIRLIQDNLHKLINEENNKEFQEKKLYEKFHMSRYLKDQQINHTSNEYNTELKYYRNFMNKTLCESWHIKALSLLVKPILFHMNIAKNNIITLIGQKSCGKTFFLHAIERYTKTLNELKSQVEWVIINLFQFETFIKTHITSEYLHKLNKYTYFVLEAISIHEYQKYINKDYFQTFLRMINSNSKCFFILILHTDVPNFFQTKIKQKIEKIDENIHNEEYNEKIQYDKNELLKILPQQCIIHFQNISTHTIYHFLKNILVSHLVQLLELKNPKYNIVEPFHDLEQIYKEIPFLDIIKKKSNSIGYDRYTKFLGDFDIMSNFSELFNVAKQINVQLPTCNFDQLQQIFYNTIIQSNEMVINTKQFILSSSFNQLTAKYIPVGSFRTLIQDKVHTPEIFLLFNDNNNDIIHEIQFLTPKSDDIKESIIASFYHTMFFNDLYPEIDSRYNLYISPDKCHILMKFEQPIIFENDQYMTYHEILLTYTFLDLFINIQKIKSPKNSSSFLHIGEILKKKLNQCKTSFFNTNEIYDDKNLNLVFPNYHVNTKFFEITKEIFRMKSSNKNNNFCFVLNINYTNISAKKLFRFQLSINELHTKDIIPQGMHENLVIDTFQQIFCKLFHQNDTTSCFVKKISFTTGFRLYVYFENFQNNDNIDFSNIEFFKNQSDVTLNCLPLIQYEMLSVNYKKKSLKNQLQYEKLSLHQDYCLTNAMDYYLVFNKAPNSVEFKKNILLPFDTKQIQILNSIYNNEQIFHLNILFFVMKYLEVSHSSSITMKSLYQELYAYCCDLLHIPLLSDSNSEMWYDNVLNTKLQEESNEEELFYHQLDSHFLRRKTPVYFNINPILILHLFHYFQEAKLFHSVREAFELFSSKANVNCDFSSTYKINWFVYNKYNDETDLIIKNNSDISHLMNHSIKLFPCNNHFIEHLYQRCLTSTFFYLFSEPVEKNSDFEILFHVSNNQKSSSNVLISSYFRFNDLKINSNIDSFLQLLHNEKIYLLRASLLTHDKHKRLILSMLLADKHYLSTENYAIMFLAYYLYFDKISLNFNHKKHNLTHEIFWKILLEDIEASLNYLYHFFDENNHEDFKIYFFCEMNSEKLKMIEVKKIHKVLNREIKNGIQDIKNTYLTPTMILDEFYLLTN